MKKIIFISAVLLVSVFSFSQMPEKFVKAMETRVIAFDSTYTVEGLTELANAFERIAEAEKDQWLPYYYAALCNAQAGLMMGGGNVMAGNPDKTDPIADKAENLLNKAEAISKDNSEIFIVKKMIATLRLIGDAMNRYMTYGPEAAAALEKAKELNPENPRVYLLEAQDKFHTPEQFGGSKAEAKILFETSVKKYEAFKPETSIHPRWGLGQAKYYLTQMQ